MESLALNVALWRKGSLLNGDFIEKGEYTPIELASQVVTKIMLENITLDKAGLYLAELFLDIRDGDIVLGIDGDGKEDNA